MKREKASAADVEHHTRQTNSLSFALETCWQSTQLEHQLLSKQQPSAPGVAGSVQVLQQFGTLLVRSSYSKDFYGKGP